MATAIIRACNAAVTVKNTGKECDTAMVAPAMIIPIDPTLTFTDTDMLDPVTWLTTQIQARRAFPMFGNKAPINSVSNAAQNDILVTLDDGTEVFLRYGINNRTFETIKGGLCFAQALQSFNSSGYSFLEVDIQGQLLARDNGDGTYSGLNSTFMYSPSPVVADFKTNPYKNRFQISYSPVELVNFGVIFANAFPFLGMMGLIDAALKLPNPAVTQTLTNITVAVKTHCAGANLVTKFGTALAMATNFIITNVATGSVITPSAVAVVAGNIQFTGTYVSGQKYNVVGTAPSVWATNLVPGYDGSEYNVIVTIP